MRVAGICGVLDLEDGHLRQTHRSIGPRRKIDRVGEPSEGVKIICEGWAACVVHLPDGRRQILSFLIPGDLVSTTTLFRARQHFDVQSLTNVRYCVYSRPELLQEILEKPPVFERVLKLGVAEKNRADDAIVSLGRRSASARIAQLVIAMFERLTARGLALEQSFEFPLRQQQIADAMGLTTVHVSRVISAFRKERLIDIVERRLHIVDLKELRRVAGERSSLRGART